MKPKLTFKQVLEISHGLETAVCTIKKLKPPHIPEMMLSSEVHKLVFMEKLKEECTGFVVGKLDNMSLSAG